MRGTLFWGQTHLSEEQEPSRPTISVSSERLNSAGKNTDEWLMYSGSYDGRRYTSLAEITPANVNQLRIRWIKQLDININKVGIEATPLVVNGVIFIVAVADAEHVFALNAKTGAVIWEYKRPIPSGLLLSNGAWHDDRSGLGGSRVF